MGLLKAIKNFILGAPKIADDVFDKENGLFVRAGGFINDLHYSDAELVRDYTALCKAVSDHVASTASENTIRSQTRRRFAILWIEVQLSLILMTAICIPFNKTMAKNFFDLATCNVMTVGTASIIVFFFGAYVYGAHVKKKGK